MTQQPPAFVVRRLEPDAATVARLADILVAVVAGGGSVSFMHPLSQADAVAFWTGSLAAAERGERVVLGAFDQGLLTATVTVLLAFPPNQPHRAEIAKMMTAPEARGRGAATTLIAAAEQEARRRRKSMLMLDTASEEGASGFYERMGYTFCGEIPDFAFKPHGGLTGTKLYWKRLERPAGASEV